MTNSLGKSIFHTRQQFSPYAIKPMDTLQIELANHTKNRHPNDNITHKTFQELPTELQNYINKNHLKYQSNSVIDFDTIQRHYNAYTASHKIYALSEKKDRSNKNVVFNTWKQVVKHHNYTQSLSDQHRVSKHLLPRTVVEKREDPLQQFSSMLSPLSKSNGTLPISNKKKSSLFEWNLPRKTDPDRFQLIAAHYAKIEQGNYSQIKIGNHSYYIVKIVDKECTSLCVDHATLHVIENLANQLLQTHKKNTTLTIEDRKINYIDSEGIHLMGNLIVKHQNSSFSSSHHTKDAINNEWIEDIKEASLLFSPTTSKQSACNVETEMQEFSKNIDEQQDEWEKDVEEAILAFAPNSSQEINKQQQKNITKKGIHDMRRLRKYSDKREEVPTATQLWENIVCYLGYIQ